MINKVTLIGNLGQDPEVRTLENGTQVGRFSLATSDSYKDKNGDWQNQTEWHNIVVWRDLAERALTQLKKGSMVYVEGKISNRKYTDKVGVERTVTDIVANTFRLLEKREKVEGASDRSFPTERPAQKATTQQVTTQQSHQPDDENDSLPF